MRHACWILSCAIAAACSPPALVQVTHSGSGAYEAALTTLGDGFAVAWHDMRDGNAEIYFRLLDTAGRPSGSEHRVTNTPAASYEASLDSLDCALVVSWYEVPRSGDTTAMLGAWNADGTARWQHVLAARARNPAIRAGGGAIVAAWIQYEPDGTEGVWTGRWNAQGERIGTPVRIGPASKTTWNLNVALDGSGAWVVFDAAESTRASEIYIGYLGPLGVRLTRLTRDDGRESKYPDLAIDDRQRAALTWYDARDGNDEVYLFVATTTDLGAEVDLVARRVTSTPGESNGAYLAWNGDRVGLAWSDEDAGQHDVFFQRFDADGRPSGDVQQVTSNRTSSLVPAIRPWRSGFVLAWNEFVPSTQGRHEGTSEIAAAVVP